MGDSNIITQGSFHECDTAPLRTAIDRHVARGDFRDGA